MIKLQTEVPIQQPNFRLNHSQKILSIGSCFAENISGFLKERKFQVESNPFGILYHPLSIARGLEMILQEKTFQKDDLFYRNELWQSFDHHSDFSGNDWEVVLNKMNSSIQQANQHLEQCDILIITLGTAFTYFKKSDNQPVANCHKIPAAKFEKRLLSVNEIVVALLKVLTLIQQKYPRIQIIFTISPIRHIRDGIIQNQQSKATLILALQELIQKLPNAFYFPSYEIVLDELRDYRFYGKDLVHLNETALAYIWQRFSDTFFEKNTFELNQKFNKLRAAFLHRPFHPNSTQHQLFLKKQYQIAKALQTQFPDLDFKKELSHFKMNMND